MFPIQVNDATIMPFSASAGDSLDEAVGYLEARSPPHNHPLHRSRIPLCLLEVSFQQSVEDRRVGAPSLSSLELDQITRWCLSCGADTFNTPPEVADLSGRVPVVSKLIAEIKPRFLGLIMMNADRLLLESMQIEMMNGGVDFYWTAMALLMLCLAVQVSVTPCGMVNSGQQLWALHAERQYHQFNQRGLRFLLDCKLQRGGANSDQDQI